MESNDTLYGCDAKFISEIDKMCTLIIVELLLQLKQLGTGRRQSLLALEFMVKILVRADLNNVGTKTLVLNLWQLSLKHGNVDIKYVVCIDSSRIEHF